MRIIVAWFQYYYEISQGFMAHIHCFLRDPLVTTFHVVGDLMIATAYTIIPLGLYGLAKNRTDLGQYKKLFHLFAAFIWCCGLTHIFNIIVLWYPIYWTEGFIKVWTGTISLITGYILWKLIPSILKIPTVGQWTENLRNLSKVEAELRECQEKIKEITKSQ